LPDAAKVAGADYWVVVVAAAIAGGFACPAIFIDEDVAVAWRWLFDASRNCQPVPWTSGLTPFTRRR
jgi:hypothetical protein